MEEKKKKKALMELFRLARKRDGGGSRSSDCVRGKVITKVKISKRDERNKNDEVSLTSL